MTEAEARAALAAFDGLGGLERWIAAQRPWEAIPTGWTVPGDLHPAGFLAPARGMSGGCEQKRTAGLFAANPAAPNKPHRLLEARKHNPKS